LSRQGLRVTLPSYALGVRLCRDPRPLGFSTDALRFRLRGGPPALGARFPLHAGLALVGELLVRYLLYGNDPRVLRHLNRLARGCCNLFCAGLPVQIALRIGETTSGLLESLRGILRSARPS